MERIELRVKPTIISHIALSLSFFMALILFFGTERIQFVLTQNATKRGTLVDCRLSHITLKLDMEYSAVIFLKNPRLQRG